MAEKETVGTVLREHSRLLGICALVFLILSWPTLVGLVKQWAADPDFSHGFVVPIVAAGILISRKGDIVATPVRRPAWGLALLLAALVVFFLGLETRRDFFQRVGLLGALCGTVGLVFGGTALVRNWFPFLLLGFTIPPPSVLFDPVRLFLKSIATRLSAELLITAGIPALPEGNVLRLGPHVLEVADACSGIRSLIAIVTAAALFAWVFRTGPIVGTLLLITAVPVTVLVNVFRIVVVAVVLDTLGIDLSRGLVHAVLGAVVFCLSLVLMYAAWRFYDWILRASRKADTECCAS